VKAFRTGLSDDNGTYANNAHQEDNNDPGNQIGVKGRESVLSIESDQKSDKNQQQEHHEEVL
jgi:hypothetical protein